MKGSAMTDAAPSITHPAKTLLANVTGDVMVLDFGEIEVGDLILFGGHLIRRVLSRPRDRRSGDYYMYLTESLDGVSRGEFQAEVGSARLVLRPTH
jgi:hypothetical protein